MNYQNQANSSGGMLGGSAATAPASPVDSAFVELEQAVSELQSLCERLTHKMQPLTTPTNQTQGGGQHAIKANVGNSPFVRRVESITAAVRIECHRLDDLLSGMEL